MASLDEVTLANDALYRIGEAPIQSFSDNTEVSNQVAAQWPASRQWLISDYPWSWAQQWQQLAQVAYPSNAGPPGQYFKYAYQLPTGIIRLNSVWYGGTNTPSSSVIGGQPNPYVAQLTATTGFIQFNNQSANWDTVGQLIISNEPFIGVWYQTDMPDTLTWTPQFGEVMTAHLTWKLAFARAKTQSLQQTMEQTYLRVLATARHNDSIGRPSQRVGETGYSNLLGIRRY